jgi:hypothetical protein
MSLAACCALNEAMPAKGEIDAVIGDTGEMEIAAFRGLPQRSGGEARQTVDPGAARHNGRPGDAAVLVTCRSYNTPSAGKIAIAASSGDPFRHFRNHGPPGTLDLTYERPTQRTKVSNYAFDAFGPYPIAGAAFAAGINQWSNSPPEWNQGVEGFGKTIRVRLWDRGIGTTTRYGLAEAFKEDTLYYRCECRALSAAAPCSDLHVDGRRGEDGHRVFSFPALVAPYAGSMTAVYGWYPQPLRRQGCIPHGQLQHAGIYGRQHCLEFFYSGPHSLLSRMHLNNAHGSPDQGPNH